jgi:3-isopropylmalate/(R)-2-methylmalate dehydratase small subunit
MTDPIVRDSAFVFTAPYVVLPRENIDTDQIIPARFLTTTSRTGLGPHAFQDWRYLADGAPDPEFPLNRDGAREARVLVAGHNFGCGSSREHAVWALLGAGFRAVVSSAFADIFRGNALGNGLLPIEVDAETLADLVARHAPGAQLGVDLEGCTLTLPSGRAVPFPVPPFARHCLLNGIDEMQFLLGTGAEADAYERRHPSAIDTTSAREAA